MPLFFSNNQTKSYLCWNFAGTGTDFGENAQLILVHDRIKQLCNISLGTNNFILNHFYPWRFYKLLWYLSFLYFWWSFAIVITPLADGSCQYNNFKIWRIFKPAVVKLALRTPKFCKTYIDWPICSIQMWSKNSFVL